MRILIVCGSIADNARIKTVLKHLEDLLKQKHTEATFWDLKERPLVIAIPELHSNPMETPDTNTQDFLNAVENADGLVLGSPLYHGSYSGVLKNALDNLRQDALRNKTVALVSNSSNIRNCTIPCDHLRLVVRSLHGHVIQGQIGTATEDFEEKDGQHILVSADIQKRCENLTEEIINVTEALNSSSHE